MGLEKKRKPGEPRCRLCALITLRAVHSDLEFAAPRDADLPDEGRAYVEHVATPDAFLCESLRNWSIVERGTLRANESAVALAGTARRSRAQLGARGLAGL